MLSYQKALHIIEASALQKESEITTLSEGLNRVLAEDIMADTDFPPFDKAAMDGYALKEAEFDQTLQITDTIPAGTFPQKAVESGKTAKIMTGAPVPKGADFVVQHELSTTHHPDKVSFTNKPKNNIIYKGSETAAGTCILQKGTLVQPHHLAILASVGKNSFPVFPPPTVGLIATGSELVEPGFATAPSQIRNSNAWQMLGQLQNIGITAKYYGICKDDFAETQEKLKEALQACDVVLLSGGVSMGEFDFVQKVLTTEGFDIKIHQVAMKPGKPFTFAQRENKYVMGLPGNPVSALIQFELLVKPLLHALMQHQQQPLAIRLPLAADYQRKKAGLLHNVPIRIHEGKVEQLNFKGSSHIHGLANSSGFMMIPEDITHYFKGELVHVRLF